MSMTSLMSGLERSSPSSNTKSVNAVCIAHHHQTLCAMRCVLRLCAQAVCSGCVLRLCAQAVCSGCVLRLCAQAVCVSSSTKNEKTKMRVAKLGVVLVLFAIVALTAPYLPREAKHDHDHARAPSMHSLARRQNSTTTSDVECEFVTSYEGDKCAFAEQVGAPHPPCLTRSTAKLRACSTTTR
jgi:hypothetical protein